MRMQFWRDAISKTYQGVPPKEPVTQLLAYALTSLDKRRGSLNKAWFLRVISTREKFLHNPPYPTLSDLESYAESTYSTLLYLTLGALPLHSVTADHIASHIGKASGIVAVLRGLPLVAFPGPQRHHSNNPTNATTAAATVEGGLGGRSASARGTITLPLDVMAQAGLREEDVFRQGASAPGLKDTVFAVATRANDHLITAREMLKRIRAGQDVGHEFEHAHEQGYLDDHHDRSDEVALHNGSGSGSGGREGWAQQEDVAAQHQQQQKQKQEVDRAFGILLSAIPTTLWLDRLQKVDFDVFRPELRSRDWRLPWRAYWAYQTRQL